VTDWRAAGLLANAHRVTNLARGSYDSPAKSRVRTRALRFIAGGLAADEKMGDLWGGGASAAEAAALGIPTISIEDGRWPKSEHGVSALVSKRALVTDAQEHGFEWRWGKADKFAGECQASFWDFCGHWCPEMRRTLKASDHHKRIVVTMMPERVPVGRGLTPAEWRATYRGLLSLTLPNHGFKWFQKYRRAEEQWAFVFGLVRTGRGARRRAYDLTPEAKARHAAYRATPEVKARKAAARAVAEARPEVKARRAAYRSTPEAKARRAACMATYNATPKGKACRAAYKVAYNATPEAKARQRSYDARPEVKARKVAYNATPEVKARQRAYDLTPEAKAHHAAFYAAHREEILAKGAAYYARKKAEQTEGAA